MGTISLTVLADDAPAGQGLESEHGFSLWVEAGGLRIIFDTGQGSTFARNARRLGLPLGSADVLVLSHGHYDHTGGVTEALHAAPGIRPVFHPGAVITRYSVRRGETARSVGMPGPGRKALASACGGEAVAVDVPRLLALGVGVTGAIPRETPWEDSGGPFFLDPEGSHRDIITDDQALWLDTEGGVVVCVGCGHAGIVNSLNQARRLSGRSEVRAVIGGLHLLNAGPTRLEKTVKALHAINPRQMVPCHCTGEGAMRLLQQTFGDRVRAGFPGLSLRF